MILTVTLNASVDKLYFVDGIQTGTVMRVREVHNSAGGKGNNVARVAALLGETVTATGFLGGFNGEYVKKMLSDDHIGQDFVPMKAETRSCINIRDLQTGHHTEFLEPGAVVGKEEEEAFTSEFGKLLNGCEVVAISGSVPEGIPEDYYCRLVQAAKEAGKKVILDTSGSLLKEGMKAVPDMIKPNQDEIGQILGYKPDSFEAQKNAVKKLHEDYGIPYAVLSLGKDGVMAACDEGLFCGRLPEIKTVNTVGCGDSMIAGFAVAMKRNLNIRDAIRTAVAVSAANAMTAQTGYFEQEDYRNLYGRVIIEKADL
jgi:tagatose 6-phosphate kinase